MKKKIFLFVGALVILPIIAVNAAVKNDITDPMYLNKMGDILSTSSLNFRDSTLKASQKLSYGINNRLSLGLGINFQEEFGGPADGFSNIGIGGAYRFSGPNEGGSKIISDAIFGIDFAGRRRVRVPEFANTVYYAGMKFGRIWNGFTLAGTVKTSWIFDENDGMAFIDFKPEAYFRLSQSWMTSIGAEIKKATNPRYNEEWINFQLIKKYDNTHYVFHTDYEFESEDFQVGIKINILF